MNIVVLKSNYLGDNVVFLPVVQMLRLRFPQWKLGLVVHPDLRELYEPGLNGIDLLAVPPDEIRTAWKDPWRTRPWLRWLRARKPEAVLLGHDQSSVAHLLATLSGARIRLGAPCGLALRRSTLTHAVEWRPEWSVAQWQWEMARTLVNILGGGDLPPVPPAPDLGHLVGDATRSDRRVVIHAGSKWPQTRWPAERFAELAGRLASHRLDVVWVRTPEVTARVPAGVMIASTPRVRDLAALIAGAALFVGNNSGPMHVANAVGTPLVVVTGATARQWDPAWHHERVRVLRQPDLPCQPCERPDRTPGGCTNAAEPLACLRRLEPAAVEAACLEQLARTNRPA